jgi:hypothetical protein
MNNEFIFPYKKIVCFGDSFTEGEDSGGPGLTDNTKTYPYFLSKLLTTTYVNLGIRGNSNSLMFIQMLDYINAHKNQLADTLFLVGLTMPARTYSGNLELIQLRGSDYSSDHIFNKSFKLKTISPSFEVKNREEHNILYSFIGETDEAHIIQTFQAMLAMLGLCKLHNVDIFFIDVILNITTCYKKYGVDFSMFDPHLLNNITIFEILTQLYSTVGTTSGHFNANGYELFAQYVYELLTAKIAEKNEQN